MNYELGVMGKMLCILLLSLLGRSLFAEDQRKFDYFFLEALRLKQKNEYTNTFHTLQYALKIDSTSSVALYEVSRYYLFLKKENLALDALKKAVAHDPDNETYKMALADLNGKLGQFNDAILLYEELAKKNPEKTELHYYLSNLYIQQRDMDKAIEALNSLENNIGINETISLQKYQLYKLINKKNEALNEIENLAAKFPTESKYQIVIGDFYLEGNEAEKALSYYEKAAKIDPDDPFYFISMANYYEYKKQSEAAALEIEKALKNPSLDIDTKLGILGRYIQGLHNTKKDIESANVLFKTLTEQHSQDKELNVMYGQFLLSQGKTDEAKFQFQVVTETLPENRTAWTQLLEIALKEENTDEIISICDGALLYFPELPEFYFYKGMAYFLRNEYQTALEVYKEGIEVINEEDKALMSNFLSQIADLYYQMGNREEAFSHYDKAIRYNEKNVAVMNNYAYYLSLEKENLDKAERMSAATVQLQPDNATYLDTYAWIFFQKGNYSLAKFYIESAISKNDLPNGDILEHYGDILYKTGNTEQAVTEWEKALLVKEEENEDTELLRKKITDKTYYEQL
jgi:tetratricopeptide (TPR) repeat protein